jgi:ATP-dependent Clp protease protease subunit
MKYLRILTAAKQKSADLYIYGPIGGSFWDDSGITDIQVAEALAELDGVDTLKVHLDSPGGDAAQGLAIYNLLVNHAVTVETIVEGWAASAASIIMQAGDTRKVSENGLVMIHDAWGFSAGNKKDFRKMAEILEKLDGNLALTYATRSGDPKAQDKFAALMSEETWFTGKEAVDEGLADSVIALKAPEDKAASTLQAAAVLLRPKFAAHYKHSPVTDDVTMQLMRMRLQLAKSA